MVLRRSYSEMNQLNFVMTGEALVTGHSGNKVARVNP